MTSGAMIQPYYSGKIFYLGLGGDVFELTAQATHAVAAISALGVHQASTTIPAGRNGYQALATWATSLGAVRAIGIEGTGSYGAGRFLTERGHYRVRGQPRQLPAATPEGQK